MPQRSGLSKARGLTFTLFKKNVGKIKDIVLVWLAITASYLFWQMSAPLLRYGYAYVLLLIALTGGMMWTAIRAKIKIADVGNLDRILCILLLMCGLVKLCSLGNYILTKIGLPYYVTQQDYGIYELDSYKVNGVTFYYSASDGRTGYDAFPSIPGKTEFIFRGDTIQEGFKR